MSPTLCRLSPPCRHKRHACAAALVDMGLALDTNAAMPVRPTGALPARGSTTCVPGGLPAVLQPGASRSAARAKRSAEYPTGPPLDIVEIGWLLQAVRAAGTETSAAVQLLMEGAHVASLPTVPLDVSRWG